MPACPLHPQPDDAIHREFADLPDDPEEFVGFAGAYGLLRTIQGPETVEELIVMRDRVRALVRAIERVNASATPDEREKARGAAARAWAQNGPVNLKTELRHVSTLSRDELRGLTVTETEARHAARFVLMARPADLYSYMMLLAASELNEEAAWRTCSVCGTLMTIKKAGRGRYRDTCSDRCRQRKHYLKQKEAHHASQG